MGDVIKRMMLITIATVAVLAFGAKALSGYRVRAVLDDLVARTSPLGDLRYLDVSTTFDGKVHIDGLSFYPGDLLNMDPLKADEAVILTPGMLYLLGFEGGPIPDRMGISLLGMRMNLARMGGLGNEGGGLSGNPFESVACGNVEAFRAPHLQEMNYASDLRMDLHLRYQMTQDSLSIKIEQASLDLSGLSLEFDLVAPGIRDNPLNKSPDEVKLSKLRLQLDSATFNKRRNTYCAEKEGVDEPEYINRNVGGMLAQLKQRGVEPSAEMVAHYRAFVSGSGSWTLETEPEPPIGMVDAAAFNTDQLLEWLNIRSTVTGEPPAVVGFNRFRLVAEVVEENTDPDAAILTESVDPRVALAQRSDPWLAVPLGDVTRAVDQRVRLDTNRGKMFTGYLVSADEARLMIETRVPGGDATIPIPFEQVTQLKIRKSVRDRLFPELAEPEEDTESDD
jgi:hypothetical protein